MRTTAMPGPLYRARLSVCSSLPMILQEALLISLQFSNGSARLQASPSHHDNGRQAEVNSLSFSTVFHSPSGDNLEKEPMPSFALHYETNMGLINACSGWSRGLISCILILIYHRFDIIS
ncbi:uncharacterized protein BDV17DRAFT_91624 [Aspergillus undulatus]|uniref:uncharacterized protein n=1 Tax=Aspergillus undulatus TaxID=1810928 RepID=UPI003CCCAA91